MKKIRYLIYLFLAGMLFFSACEKDSLPTLPDNDLKKSAKAKTHMGNAILLEPEGADYDTDNLMAAFAEAKEHGPGAVIHLAEGEFYLDYVEVHDFDGWLKGSGMNKTIIHPHPDGIRVPSISAYHMNFIGGNIKISDMYFEFAEETVTQPWAGDWTFVHDVIKFNYDPGTSNPVNAMVKNVKFSGIYAPNNYTAYNVNNAIGISGSLYNFYGPIPGNLIVENCEFYTLDAPVLCVGLEKGQFKYGGSPQKANYSDDTNFGLMLLDNKDLEVVISNNTFSKVHIRGIDIEQGEFPPELGIYPSNIEFQIRNNKISLDNASLPIYIQEGLSYTDPSLYSSGIISKNEIGFANWGVYMLYNFAMNNVNISANKMLGESYFGFYIGGAASNNNIINNDFNNQSGAFSHIWLGPNTYDNKIICDPSTIIWDDGTNNLIRGPHMMGNSMNAPGHLPKVKPIKKIQKLMEK